MSKELPEGVTQFSLYKGKVQVKFYGPTEDKPNRHMYYADTGGGFKRKGGCTTFIGIKDKSIPLGKWYQQITVDFLLNAIKAGKKIDHDLVIEAAVQNDILKRQAADIGNLIHAWCEEYINFKIGVGKRPDMPQDPKVLSGAMAFLDWEKEEDMQFKTSEKVVYSKKHDYIGTLDIEAMSKRKRYLIDIKSSNGLYNSVRLQTAAYVKADEEESGNKYAGRWALRLSKHTEEEFNEIEARKKEIKDFIAKHQGWKIKEYPPKQFQVFEAKYLDADESLSKLSNMDRDFKQFLGCMSLYRWDQETNAFLVGDNW